MSIALPLSSRAPRLAVLALPATALGLALSVQVSVLSWLLSTRYGLSIDAIGVVWAAGPIAGILGQLLIGDLSDRSWWLGGRRRPFLLVSAFASSLALLALPHLDAIADRLGLGIIVVAAAVALTLDLAINIGLNPARAIVADMTREGAERSRGFVWMQTLSGGASVLAYGAGAWLGNMALILVAPAAVLALGVLPTLRLREPRTLAAVDGAAPLTIADVATMTAPLAPLVALLIVQAGGAALGHPLPIAPLLGATALATFAAALPALRSRAEHQVSLMRKVVTAHGLAWLGTYCLFIFLAPVLRQRLPDLSADDLGRVAALGFLAFNAVGALAPLAILGPATRRFRRAHVHAAALALMAASFVAIGLFVHSPAQLWLLLALAGVGWGAMVSLPFAILCDRVDARRLGLILGVFNLAIVVPQLVASLGLGALAATLADRGLIFVIAGVAIAASALAWLSVPPLALTAPETRRT